MLLHSWRSWHLWYGNAIDDVHHYYDTNCIIIIIIIIIINIINIINIIIINIMFFYITYASYIISDVGAFSAKNAILLTEVGLCTVTKPSACVYLWLICAHNIELAGLCFTAGPYSSLVIQSVTLTAHPSPTNPWLPAYLINMHCTGHVSQRWPSLENKN